VRKKIFLCICCLVFVFFAKDVSYSQETRTGATPPYKKPLLDIKVTTDKEFYLSTDLVKITIKNNIDKSIFMHINTFCINHIGSYDGEKFSAYCDYPDCVYDMDAPDEIKPGESVEFMWQLRYYNRTKKEMADLIPGDYCLVTSYQIREGDESVRWKWLLQNSNKFTIAEIPVE